MKRREFLKGTGLTGAAIAFGGSHPLWANTTRARVDIFPDEPIGTISPDLYGQFIEHIGGVIYDGVWVGPDSRIPNQYGIRKELIDRLREIHLPIIRWPGGCFADSYDWRDGVGPVAQRPRRTNFWEVDHDAARLHDQGKQIFEPNSFGTNEFMRLCNLTGAQPYLAANVRSLPPLSFDHWIEYCNAPRGSTILADLRAAAGFPDPFGVRYWGVGNESWGCGGSFTPEEYAAEFRRYTSWLPRFGVDLQLIGSGPSGDDRDWSHRFFAQIYGDPAYRNAQFAGWSVHFYASDLSRGRKVPGQPTNGDALAFDAVDWYELLRQCDRMGQILEDQWAILGQYDTAHRVKLAVDEYGPWYREGTEVDPTHIFGQQITIRDALATALTLDTFNRHAEKILLATNAQLINNLNALFLAHEDRFVATPNFYVFTLYAAHQGGAALRTEFSAPDLHYLRNGRPATFWGLNGSASIKGKRVTLTAVNSDLNQAVETEVQVQGTHVQNAAGTIIAAGDMHAHNTFDQPDVVHSTPHPVSPKADHVRVTIPPASVFRLEIDLT
jgi:alpha-N-arabinofuranosidase